jgi:hypothetical protein
MSTDPTITPNPSGCDPAPGLLHHHAARVTMPDGSMCDVLIATSALRPGASYQWAASIDHATRERLGHAVARAFMPRDFRPHPYALVLPEEMAGASLAAVWRAAFTAGFDSGQDTGYAQGHADLAEHGRAAVNGERLALADALESVAAPLTEIVGVLRESQDLPADAATMRRERDAATTERNAADLRVALDRVRAQRDTAQGALEHAEAECAALRLHIDRFSLGEPGGGQ